jgi:hypothetical protein
VLVIGPGSRWRPPGRSAVPVRPALAYAIVGVSGVLAAFTFTAGVTDAAATRSGSARQPSFSAVSLNGQSPPRVP